MDYAGADPDGMLSPVKVGSRAWRVAVWLLLAGCQGTGGTDPASAAGMPGADAPAPGSTAGQSASPRPMPAAPPAAQAPDGGTPSSVPLAPADAAAVEPEPDATMPPAGNAASRDAIAALREYLETPAVDRPPLDEQGFAFAPLTREDAATARELLWDDYATRIHATRQAEFDAESITLGDFTLRYDSVVLGDEPPTGRSLFLSLHGGGSTGAATNDSQWRNQIALAGSYAPEDALWVAPRAPTDDWNMWFKDHIDALFDRVITNMIVFEGIDPNRVYVMGYSAGGDGVYQIGPRMADRWAGAVMSAGHPNDASPRSLRNVAFALHVGGEDAAFDRNRVAGEWGAMLDALQAADPEGYPHQVEVHAGLGHWMELADAVAMPFVQAYVRDPVPTRVVWRQANITQSRFYWLAVAPVDELAGSEVSVRRSGQNIDIEEASGLSRLVVRVNDAMVDMDQPVVVSVGGETRFEAVVERTISSLHRTIDERGDPELVFSGELMVEL